jgi:hypothetical protein
VAVSSCTAAFELSLRGMRLAAAWQPGIGTHTDIRGCSPHHHSRRALPGLSGRRPNDRERNPGDSSSSGALRWPPQGHDGPSLRHIPMRLQRTRKSGQPPTQSRRGRRRSCYRDDRRRRSRRFKLRKQPASAFMPLSLCQSAKVGWSRRATRHSQGGCGARVFTAFLTMLGSAVVFILGTYML